MKKLFGTNKDRMGVDQKAVLLVSKVNESKRHGEGPFLFPIIVILIMGRCPLTRLSSSSPSFHHLQRHKDMEAEVVCSQRLGPGGQQRRRVVRRTSDHRETR